MNRSHIFQLCAMYLATLRVRVEMLGKLNILNLHVHCEDFYAGLLNRLYSLQLKNMNAYVQNAEGIDLIDSVAKVLLQVSSTATAQKVNAALGKDLSEYKGHEFRFISISKDASHLRNGIYLNPHGLVFDPKEHIYDVESLLKIIQHLELAKQREIYDFLRDELSESGSERPMAESNLASVINIISKTDLHAVSPDTIPTDFNVDEKVAYNGLVAAAGVIEDYKICHPAVDRIYAEFDDNAVNKSKSVLDAFRMTYLKLSTSYSGDELYFQIVEQVITKIQESSNFVEIPLEELQLCVNVLAVDAFIRCKIFKKPTGMINAAA